jgi:predicted restriction endonuclease
VREIPVDDQITDADFTGQARVALVKQRLKQAFFRRTVLSGYGEKCCISGVSDKRLLVASHIVAWKDDASIRLHPGNGLCLSAIHDKAFDQHLFSLTDDWRIILSKQLKATKDDFLQQVFWSVEDKKIHLPEKFVPERAFVARHRQTMLQEA